MASNYMPTWQWLREISKAFAGSSVRGSANSGAMKSRGIPRKGRKLRPRPR